MWYVVQSQCPSLSSKTYQHLGARCNTLHSTLPFTVRVLFVFADYILSVHCTSDIGHRYFNQPCYMYVFLDQIYNYNRYNREIFLNQTYLSILIRLALFERWSVLHYGLSVLVYVLCYCSTCCQLRNSNHDTLKKS